MIIENAFIASKNGRGIDGDGHPGTVRDCYLYAVGGYTPHLFRRSRLQRLAPLARRAHLARAVWRWSA